MRTREEYFNLLDETVKDYSEDTSRRATNGVGCEYITSDGRMCAVGRCLENPQAIMDNESLSGEWAVRVLLSDLGKLKPEYEGFSISFWRKLQNLHDEESYWDEEGLTSSGQKFYAEIALKINQGAYETNESN